jgi:hypothetical protein
MLLGFDGRCGGLQDGTLCLGIFACTGALRGELQEVRLAATNPRWCNLVTVRTFCTQNRQLVTSSWES